MNVQEKIRNQVTANSVVLYMKGTPQSPQCGFSGATVQILKACRVQNFTAVIQSNMVYLPRLTSSPQACAAARRINADC